MRSSFKSRRHRHADGCGLFRWVPGVWLLGVLLCGPSRAAQPNVLFIAIDDLANSLGCYGHPVVQSPHIDWLATSGVRFDRAYNQLPLCNPSRASVLTGLRPDAIKVYDLDRHFRDELPGVITLPQLFRQNGWFSARVGKIYHYNVPAGIGTDGLDDKPSWDQVVNPKGRDTVAEETITNAEPHRPISAALSWRADEGPDEEQTDGMIASEAIRLMERHRGQPFFLGVGFFRPHTPYVAPRKYFDLYPLDRIRLPQAPADDRDDIPPGAFAHNCPVPHYGLPEATCRRALQAYYASVSFVDAQVGRLLDALDRLELADRTIVILWSDHGYHLGEHLGVWQKRTLFEESARAPLIIRAPGAKGNGRASRQIVEFVDIYPTVADLAGVKPPSTLSGRSLRALLENPEKTWNGAAYTQILRPGDNAPFVGRSIRTDRWRYSDWGGRTGGAELYDHNQDPNEWKNLASEPEWAGVVEELRKRLDAHVSPKVPDSPFNPPRL
jgi:iduronate 2-sulfatase